ncbi:unnamed protein product, partial [Darwinula stevensoni]
QNAIHRSFHHGGPASVDPGSPRSVAHGDGGRGLRRLPIPQGCRREAGVPGSVLGPDGALLLRRHPRAEIRVPPAAGPTSSQSGGRRRDLPQSAEALSVRGEGEKSLKRGDDFAT